MTYASNLDATTNANKFPTVGGVVTTPSTGAVSGTALPPATNGIEKLANAVPVITYAGAPLDPSNTIDGTDKATAFTTVAFSAGVPENTTLYWLIKAGVAANTFIVEFYTDSAHTAANKVAASAEALASAAGVVISEANDSGITGTLTLDSDVAAHTTANNKVVVFKGTGYTYCPKGSICVDTTNGKLYINGGTAAVPAWKLVTSA